MNARLGERLINTRLIGAERAAALQHQGDAFEWRTVLRRRRMRLALLGHVFRQSTA